MKTIIQFHISKGEDYYVAEGVDVAIITQGKTLDELAENIKEAVVWKMGTVTIVCMKRHIAVLVEHLDDRIAAISSWRQ